MIQNIFIVGLPGQDHLVETIISHNSKEIYLIWRISWNKYINFRLNRNQFTQKTLIKNFKFEINKKLFQEKFN